MTSLQGVFVSATSVGRGSNEAVTLLYLIAWPITPTYGLKTQYSKHYYYDHWPESTLTQQIAVCFLYCFSVPWVFCQAVLLLTYIVANSIGSYPELDWWNIIHILGFITQNLSMSYDYSSFSNISGMDVGGSECRQCLSSIEIRHMVRPFDF